MHPKKGAHNLDKLAQLLPSSPSAGFSDLGKLKKRAKAKYFTSSYLKHLIELDSPLKKSYTNTLYCCDKLYQSGEKITSKYCNNRWCIVCNRIRIGKAINGYMPELRELDDPQFVTLTVPNVNRGDLRASITGMTRTWRAIYMRLLKYRKITVRGIRKTECTYNPITDTYHPHFHFIVSGEPLAQLVVEEWLERNPTADLKAQHYTEADEGSMLELFKYFTKIITKDKLYIPALDQVFQAMAGLRVFQPFGIRRISEEVEELQAEVICELVSQDAVWEWMNHDWIESATSRSLTGFQPSPQVKKLLENIYF